MTKAQLKRTIRILLIFGVALIIISALDFFNNAHHNRFIAPHMAFFAIAFAAYFAYALQRRGKYIDDLRTWWNDMCIAKSAILEYCDLAPKLKSPELEKAYFSSFYKISTAMDKLRLIFCNVDRTAKNQKGYYPFEQIRDIIDVCRNIDPNITDYQKNIRSHKRAIDALFTSLRHSIQLEADLVPPDHPFTFEHKERAEYLTSILASTGVDITKIRGNNKGR